jgi:hypothetical protein
MWLSAVRHCTPNPWIMAIPCERRINSSAILSITLLQMANSHIADGWVTNEARSRWTASVQCYRTRKMKE